MARHYNEKDLAFYTEIEVSTARVDVTSKGRVITWKKINDVEGYAIYKGSGNLFRSAPNRYVRIVFINNQHDTQDPTYFIPTRNNIALDEVRIQVEGVKGYLTDVLPKQNFRASSNYDDSLPVADLFKGQGWQSQKLNSQSRSKDSLREWISIDLGYAVKIEKLIMKNSSTQYGLCGAYEYRIDISEDGSYWKPLHQGSLNFTDETQEIDLTPFYYEGEAMEEDWALLETVGSSISSYVDAEGAESYHDYRITGIVNGDLSFETTEVVYEEIENDNGGFITNKIETVDLKITGEHESVRQDMTNRVRSQKGQWRNHHEIGADLELLEGLPNTRANAERGAGMIVEALTEHNRIHARDLSVRAIPKSITQLDFYMMVTSDASEEPIVVVNKTDI